MVFKVKNFLVWFSLPTCLAIKTGVSPCLDCKHISITLFSCQFLSMDWGLNKAITKSPTRAPSILFSIKDHGVNLSLKLTEQKSFISGAPLIAAANWTLLIPGCTSK